MLADFLFRIIVSVSLQGCFLLGGFLWVWGAQGLHDIGCSLYGGSDVCRLLRDCEGVGLGGFFSYGGMGLFSAVGFSRWHRGTMFREGFVFFGRKGFFFSFFFCIQVWVVTCVQVFFFVF
jgi:hypothetical protein